MYAEYDNAMVILWWFYDSVHLCLFWFTLKGRGEHSHAGRDLAIHPSRSFSVGYVQPCFRDVAVCQQCPKGFPTWAANHHLAMGLAFRVPGCRIVDAWFSCISVTGWTDHWDDTELVVCLPGSNWYGLRNAVGREASLPWPKALTIGPIRWTTHTYGMICESLELVSIQDWRKIFCGSAWLQMLQCWGLRGWKPGEGSISSQHVDFSVWTWEPGMFQPGCYSYEYLFVASRLIMTWAMVTMKWFLNFIILLGPPRKEKGRHLGFGWVRKIWISRGTSVVRAKSNYCESHVLDQAGNQLCITGQVRRDNRKSQAPHRVKQSKIEQVCCSHYSVLLWVAGSRTWQNITGQNHPPFKQYQAANLTYSH